MNADMNPIVAGLIITAIGMGLVFVVIILLWGLMALLVNLTARIKTGEAEAEPEAAAVPVETPVDDETRLLKKRAAAAAVAALIPGDMRLLKQRAAAAAVSAAIVFNQQAASSASPAVSVSHWQAAARASILNARSNLYSRKNMR